MKIWANTIVNNEENFLWFAVMSVLDYVDKILIWDTGSTDKTVDIIREIEGDKVVFKKVGQVDKYGFTKMRQSMLEESDCDWILILDGDEIWWEDSIKKVVNAVNNTSKHVEGIVVPMVVPVGDIFHFQEANAGKYKILGRVGHLSLKAFSKKIPGLHVENPYGSEGFFDGQGKAVQEREKMIFLDAPILHVTHLKRSSLKKVTDKYKHELGEKAPPDYKYPEILYLPYPSFISSPWVKIHGTGKMISQILTPLRKIKRRL